MFKQFGTFIISLIFIHGLTTTNQVIALDDFNLYKYGAAEKVKIGRKSFIVKFVIYDNESDLNDAYYKDNERPEGQGVRAFSLSTKDEDVCYIHLKPATKWDDHESMTNMGHEIYHCALARHKVASYDDLEKEIVVKMEEESNVVEDANVVQGLRPKQHMFNKQPVDKLSSEKTKEELLAEDRKLELEWLMEDYKKMGIKVDE